MMAELQRHPQGVNIDELTDAEAQRLVQSGWRYGDPAPPTFRYGNNGLLEHIDRTAWDYVAQYGSLAVPAVATVATGGAASPWLMAAAGGITGAMAAGEGGDWKQMLRGGLVGGATAGAGAGIANSGLNTGAKVAAQGALGAGSGAIQGGGKGALIGGIAGAGAAGAGQLGQQQAASGASRAQQLMTQAGIHSALGGLTGGAQGALIGGGTGALNSALYQQRYNNYLQKQQQQPQRTI